MLAFSGLFHFSFPKFPPLNHSVSVSLRLHTHNRNAMSRKHEGHLGMSAQNLSQCAVDFGRTLALLHPPLWQKVDTSLNNACKFEATPTTLTILWRFVPASVPASIVCFQLCSDVFHVVSFSDVNVFFTCSIFISCRFSMSDSLLFDRFVRQWWVCGAFVCEGVSSACAYSLWRLIRVLFVCRTGRHRSVAGATLLHKLLERAGVRVSVIHRTVERS